MGETSKRLRVNTTSMRAPRPGGRFFFVLCAVAIIVSAAGLEASELHEAKIQELTATNSQLRSDIARLKAELREAKSKPNGGASRSLLEAPPPPPLTLPPWAMDPSTAVCKERKIFDKCQSQVFKTFVLVAKTTFLVKTRHLRAYRSKAERGATFLLPMQAAVKTKQGSLREAFCYDVSCEIIKDALKDAPSRNAPNNGKGVMVPKTSAAFNYVIDLKLMKTLKPTEHAAGKCPGGTTKGPCTTYAVEKKCELLYSDEEGIKLKEIVVPATKNLPATKKPDLQSNQGLKEFCALL